MVINTAQASRRRTVMGTSLVDCVFYNTHNPAARNSHSLEIYSNLVTRNRLTHMLFFASGLAALVYAVNTAGGLIGVVIASIFMPAWGVCGSGYLAAALSAVCGLMALALSRAQPRSTDISQPAAGDRAWLWLAAVSGFGTLALE